MHYAIENTAARVLLRIVAIPVTLLAALGAVDGIGFLLGGLEKNNPWPVSFGLGTFVSYFGIAGAWMRISNKYESLSRKKVRVIRGLLSLGVVGAFLLAAGAFGIFGGSSYFGSAVFMVLGAIGVFFIRQTPGKP